MTQRTKANGFVYTQHSLLCFLSIVQVPRITSLFPRMTFRPLFSTVQTASLLSSHPVEAAMCGVAGAMYYLCERAFASRWKPAKVCLFLLALEITFTSMFPPRGALPKLWQELKLRLGHCTWLTLISMCVGYLCVFNHLTGKRNQFWKDSKLKCNITRLSMGQTLNVTTHEDPAAKIQQNYCNPWTMLKRIRFYVSNKIHCVEWKGICNLFYLKTYIRFCSSAHLRIRTCRITNSYVPGKANQLKRKTDSFTPM